jgi:NAD(P)-dependent dehydrogenase (short-subunit alcohol dehydrogenase family)
VSDLDGRVAIVTGGAQGIHFGCTEKLSAAGTAVVIAVARTSGEKLVGPALAAPSRNPGLGAG